MRPILKLTILLWLSLLTWPLRAADVLPLAGEWRARLDPQDAGVAARWYATALPGRKWPRRPGILAHQVDGHYLRQLLVF
jgi:hypothetical protein